MTQPKFAWPDYGIDAPAVMRNLFLAGAASILAGVLLPHSIHIGPVIIASMSFFWMGASLLLTALSFLLYVKVGKFKHRDKMLAMVAWRGDEQVLDVGCGRGLLLAGAAKRLTTGHATGIDVWSNVDMGGNSPEATTRNLQLEQVEAKCTLLSEPAQSMTFPDAYFDVILSNLCLHNIYDLPTRRAAIHQIVRVLKPGGVALISDYKLTGEYEREFLDSGLIVQRSYGYWMSFPPLRIVLARKPR